MISGRTSPRRACEDDRVCPRLESILHLLEAVSQYPIDLASDAIDLSVVFGALQSLWIFFDGKDLIPSALARESDSVATNTGKCVNNDSLLFWHSLGYVNRNLAVSYKHTRRDRRG